MFIDAALEIKNIMCSHKLCDQWIEYIDWIKANAQIKLGGG
jgi:hypothetical protein